MSEPIDKGSSGAAAAVGGQTVEDGPSGFRNWRCHLAGMETQGCVEFALYSDSHLTGHITEGFGPYMVLNTIAISKVELPALNAILRMEWHVPPSAGLPPMDKTRTGEYHAGGVADEIAALLSLALGARLHSGGMVREFETDGDPRGRPWQHSHSRPALPVARAQIVPELGSRKNLNHALEQIAIYPEIRPSNAIEVVRAARAYQAGVWMSDADPEYAWLKFVSALEIAANCWERVDDPESSLRTTRPELAELLAGHGGNDLVRVVGTHLMGQIGATRKFLNFTRRYSPGPPELRPSAAFQVDWEQMESHLRVVYRYRSRALHGGLPFPRPMLQPAYSLDAADSASAEKPLGLATSDGPAVWRAKDLPMHLHIFEYLTRRALLSWFNDREEGPCGERPHRST